jgi:formyl-CoA transferase
MPSTDEVAAARAAAVGMPERSDRAGPTVSGDQTPGRTAFGAVKGPLQKASVPTPLPPSLRADQVYAAPQVREQGLVVEVEHPSLGPIELPGPALSFGRSAARRHQAPPTLGQHSAAIRGPIDARRAA